MNKHDKILICILILLTFNIYLFVNRKIKGTSEKLAKFSVNGKEVKEILLSENLNMDFIIESFFGKNVVEIRNGKVRIKDASCKDKLDVKKGYIENINESLVCIPNRFIVEILPVNDTRKIDVINR